MDGRAEGLVKGVDGLALEAELDVGVDAGGDADVGVAEEFLDDARACIENGSWNGSASVTDEAGSQDLDRAVGRCW